MQRFRQQLIRQTRSHVARSRFDQRQMCSGSPNPKAKMFNLGRTYEYMIKKLSSPNLFLLLSVVSAALTALLRSMESDLLILKTKLAELQRLKRETKSDIERSQTAAEELAIE